MKRRQSNVLKISVIAVLFFAANMIAAQSPSTSGNKNPANPKAPKTAETPAEKYTIEQSVSEKAQLSTLSFSALAFLTGTFGADTFLPPGKAADYFGFQYMRDIDIREAGHNMMFLTNISYNMIKIFSTEQNALLLSLAKEQEKLYKDFAYKRLLLIKAFRQNLEGSYPAGYKALSQTAVMDYVAGIFDIDGLLSFRRAEVYGSIVKSLTPAQIASIKKLTYGDSSTWPAIPDPTDKKAMTHDQNVLVMTYASEFFSWYAGSLDGDVYFCPERHGTYFGGFYMKDYPAMGNPDYFIPTALTGDSGEAFLAILDESQRQKIVSIMDSLNGILSEILEIRRTIAAEFRKYLAGGTADKALVLKLSHRYGELDGQLSFLFASRFAEVGKTLTAAQKSQLTALRNQSIFPKGIYIFADPIETPVLSDTSLLFSK